MRFESNPTFTSALFPEVSVKLRKLSHGMRTRIDLKLADSRAKIRVLSDERAEIIEPAREAAEASVPVDAPERDAAVNAAIEKALSRDDMRTLRDRLASINFLVYSEIQPGYLNQAVKSITGLEIDKEGDDTYTACATVADLIEYGPPELVKEIYDEIQAGVTGLSAEERKNSLLVSTLPARVDSPTNDMTVAPVGETPGS